MQWQLRLGPCDDWPPAKAMYPSLIERICRLLSEAKASGAIICKNKYEQTTCGSV